MENNCSRAAANWWAKKIEEASLSGVKNLNAFEKRLSLEIYNKVSQNAYMIISTYKHSSNILDNVALKTEMFSFIPIGYEMHISYDFVASIYDSNGKLVAAFS